MFKYLLVIFTLASLSQSCKAIKKPNLQEIEATTFGDFVLGESVRKSLDRVNELASTQRLKYTTNTNYPYQEFSTVPVSIQQDFYFFPHLRNTDSFITKIEFYVYVKDYTFQTALKDPELFKSSLNEFMTEERFYKQIEEDEARINDLTRNFKLTTNIDPVTHLTIPEIGHNLIASASVERINAFIEKGMNLKYGSNHIDKEIGNKYDPHSMYYSIKTWENENLTVSLISQNMPSSGEIDKNNYFTVLSYSFKPEILKKYGLEDNIQVQF